MLFRSGFEEYAKNRFANYPNSPFNLSPDEFLSEFKNTTLSDLGFEFDLDEEGNEQSRNRGYEYTETNKLSAFTGISEKIDFLFSTITDTEGEPTEYGHAPLIPKSKVKAYLANLLHDNFTLEEMADIMGKIYEQDSAHLNSFERTHQNIVVQILESLGPMNADLNSVLLHTEFFDAMTLVYQSMLIQLHYFEGNSGIIDSMKEKIKDRVRDTWISGLSATDYIETVDGQRFIRDYSKLKNMTTEEFIKTAGMKFNHPINPVLVEEFKNAIDALPKKAVKIGRAHV